MSNLRLIEEERRLLKRVHKLAWEEWVRGRKQSGVPSFIGKGIKPRLREQVEVALITCDEGDVLEAIHQVSRDPNGAPWDIPKRAMYLGSQRRDLEHLERKMHERSVEDTLYRPRVEGVRHVGQAVQQVVNQVEKEKGE